MESLLFFITMNMWIKSPFHPKMNSITKRLLRVCRLSETLFCKGWIGLPSNVYGHVNMRLQEKPVSSVFRVESLRIWLKKKKPLPRPVDARDVAEIVKYAIEMCGCNSIQITGGSTFDYKKEYQFILSYLEAINQFVGRESIIGDILLYITPPKDVHVIDEYFKLGVDKVACSIEVWDENLAKTVTPGKIDITTRERHLTALEYISETYGGGKAFSNFIIGIEPYDTLKEGATYLAQRGIIPTASIWMPMGRPVNGSMQTPEIEYYQKVKELFAELYRKYNLEPSKCHGLNVCMERDIWNYSQM
jgi:hypothetical protein